MKITSLIPTVLIPTVAILLSACGGSSTPVDGDDNSPSGNDPNIIDKDKNVSVSVKEDDLYYRAKWSTPDQPSIQGKIVPMVQEDDNLSWQDFDGEPRTAKVLSKSVDSLGKERNGLGFNTLQIENPKLHDSTGDYYNVEGSTSFAGFYTEASDRGVDYISFQHQGLAGHEVVIENSTSHSYAFFDEGNLASQYSETLPPNTDIIIDNVVISVQYSDLKYPVGPREIRSAGAGQITSSGGKFTLSEDGSFTGGWSRPDEEFPLSIKGQLDGHQMKGSVDFRGMHGEVTGFYGQSDEENVTTGVMAGQDDKNSFSGGWGPRKSLY